MARQWATAVGYVGELAAVTVDKPRPSKTNWELRETTAATAPRQPLIKYGRSITSGVPATYPEGFTFSVLDAVVMPKIADEPCGNWEVFANLRDTWRNETRNSSSGTDMVLHPSYLRIIGMGRPIIPVLLRELRNDPDYWFPALEAVTRENPVNPRDRGDLDAMAQAWLKWGREKGYLI